MKITLKSLTFKNWKGIDELATNFKDETTISGDNMTGKTRHFDAYLWLLTGKDSQNRLNTDIRTLINGSLSFDGECSIEGVFELNGREVTLKRELKAKFSKNKGDVTKIYNGEKTKTYYNGSEKTISEYNDIINSIIGTDVFRLLSDPAYFTSLNWKLQRSQLLSMVTFDVSEVIEGNKNFEKLINEVDGTLDNYKLDLSREKKKLKKEENEVSVQIDQTIKLTPEKIDFAAKRCELADVDAKLDTLNKSISLLTEEKQKDQDLIYELKSQSDKLFYEAQKEENKKNLEQNSEIQKLKQDILDYEESVKTSTSKIKELNERIELVDLSIKEKKEWLETLRESWTNENADPYIADEVCFACGQKLPADKIAKAKEIFMLHKKEALKDIADQGKIDKEGLNMLNKEKTFLLESIEKHKSNLTECEKDIKETKKLLSSIKVPEKITKQSIIQCVKIEKQIDSLEKKTYIAPSNEREHLVSLRDSIKEALLDEAKINNNRKEVEKLEAKGRGIAQQIAEIERKEMVISDFIKARINNVESKINNLFDIVSFKLFETQINGEEKETCEASINGIPFSSVNTATQVNAGIDIINAMSRFYDINAPIFIDRRESVNNLIKTNSQIINLIVTKQPLTIK